MNLSKIKKALATLLLITGIPTTAYCDTFIVGVENLEYYPLYEYKDGQYKGLAQTMLDQFGKDKGHTFEYKPFPVLRLTKYFVEKAVDFKFPDNEYWAKDAKLGHTVVYSDPVMEYTDGVLVIPERKGKGIDGFKKLGTVRGFTPWTYMSLIKSGSITVNEGNSLNAVVKQALNNRVDGAYFNVSVAKYFLEHQLKKPNVLVFDESLPHTTSNYHLSSIKHPNIIKQFNAWQIEQAGWILDKRREYGLE
ncbi:hypothetical protein A9Q81_14500 [Gammaproteobacteria bacterium 42_54_T18]|nr:hypothetical protein A9Q81_14500 [Gammaproteobacteria bacterium 42_54_T18]